MIIVMLVIFLLAMVAQQCIFRQPPHTDQAVEQAQPQNAEEYTNISPLTQDQGAQRTKANPLDREKELERQIAQAKAKDFMERLQVSQSSGRDGAGSGEVGGAASMSSTGGAVEAEGRSDSNGDSSFSHHQNAMTSDDPNTAFLLRASNSKAEREVATHFGPLPYVVAQGKFIVGTLTVAINSDLPGQIEAVVNQDMYGEQGRKILIPKGSHLIGEYRSGLANHQSRLFTVWTRIKEPNGIDVRLGSPGTDDLGRSGLTGQVDYHFFDRFGSALLISMISAGASNAGVSASDGSNSASAYRQGVAQSLSEQANSTLNQNINIPPTIHIPQGEKIVVFVNKDLDFSRVYQ